MGEEERCRWPLDRFGWFRSDAMVELAHERGPDKLSNYVAKLSRGVCRKGKRKSQTERKETELKSPPNPKERDSCAHTKKSLQLLVIYLRC